jgi:hypothetical protein
MCVHTVTYLRVSDNSVDSLKPQQCILLESENDLLGHPSAKLRVTLGLLCVFECLCIFSFD